MNDIIKSWQPSRREILEELNAPIKYECEGNESDLEDNIIENLDLICQGMNLTPPNIVWRQKRIDTDGFSIKPDIIVRHQDHTVTIFEVKKTNHKYPSTGTTNQMNAVGQLLLYGNVFFSKSGVFPRLALIDNKIYYRTYCAFLGNKLPIALIDFQKDRVFVPYNGWCYG